MDMSTHPTVPKARAAILSAQVGGGLTGQDRKLFNFLLAVAYPNMLTQNIHKVLMADARGFLGAHESNDQIRASLRRLASVILDFDYTTEDGEERFAVGGLLSASGPKGEGVIRYQFGLDVAPILAEPAVFARLKLAVLGQFVSKYAGILYELLELRANLKEPEWTISVDDLRALMGATNKVQTHNFAHFRNKALLPALSEINDKADISVSMIEQKNGRKVAALTFMIEKKAFREAMESEMRHKAIRQRRGAAARVERTEGGERDVNTFDMLDGRTDQQRGGFPPLLTATGIEAARAMFSNWNDSERPDIYALEKEWLRAQEGREAPRDPDKAFLNWCRTYSERRKHKRIT